MTYAVKETFLTLQGEGVQAGLEVPQESLKRVEVAPPLGERFQHLKSTAEGLPRK